MKDKSVSRHSREPIIVSWLWRAGKRVITVDSRSMTAREGEALARAINAMASYVRRQAAKDAGARKEKRQ